MERGTMADQLQALTGSLSARPPTATETREPASANAPVAAPAPTPIPQPAAVIPTAAIASPTAAPAAFVTPASFPKVNMTNSAAPRSLRTIRGVGIIRSQPTEALAEMVKRFTTDAANLITDPSIVVGVKLIDQSIASNLIYPAVVVIAQDKTMPEKAVYHTLLVASNAQLPTIARSFAGTQYGVLNTPSDVFNSVYAETVHQVVQGMLKGVNLISMDAEVIPANVDIAQDKVTTQEILVNTLNALLTGLEELRPNHSDIRLPEMDLSEPVVVRVGANEPLANDIFNNPMRSDVSIITSVMAQGGTEKVLNSEAGSSDLTLSGGYVDLQWAPEEAPAMPYSYGGVPPVMPKFLARMVITDMQCSRLLSTNAQLLALASTAVLAENNRWYTVLNRRGHHVSSRVVDPRDPGALAIEANLERNPNGFGSFVDTRGADFTDQQLGQLIGMSCRPNIAFALRVSERSYDTWFNGVFAAAANGNSGAIQRIVDAANELTGGRFSAHYPTSMPPVVVDGSGSGNNIERVHAGWYIDENNTKRPLSDVDYLFVMNTVGRTDPTVGQRWTDTFTRTDLPLEMRLAARQRMIEEIVKSQVVYTGWDRIVTINAKFMEALAKSIAECGLVYRVAGLNAEGYINQRASFGAALQSQMSNQATGLYSMGGAMASNPGYAAQGRYVGRWN